MGHLTRGRTCKDGWHFSPGLFRFGRMKARKRKPAPARTRAVAGRRTKDRQLVAVDQEPLRRKAVSECGREMARLEKLRAEWRQFESEDRPGFERWKAATFGALLSEMREQESALREREAFIFEVEEEMFFRGTRSHRAAYAAVMRRRANPPPDLGSDPGGPPPEEDDDGEFEDPFSGGMPEFEQHLLFEDFLRAMMGIDPDRMSDRKYDAMFEDFKAKILGQGAREEPRRERERERPPEPVKPEHLRIKEIYRVLVRRLHPDTRADKDAEISALWHEVQEAYGTGNLERLEMLLALTDIRSNAVGGHTSLSQMRSVLRELRRSFNALKRSLGSAKRDPAWNFARSPDRSQLRSRLQREFESQLSSLKTRLRDIEKLISSWAASPKARRRAATSNQPEFGF